MTIFFLGRWTADQERGARRRAVDNPAPAAIYFALNFSDPVLRHGWAVPIATDIALLIRPRVSAALPPDLLRTGSVHRQAGGEIAECCDGAVLRTLAQSAKLRDGAFLRTLSAVPKGLQSLSKLDNGP